MKKIFLSIAVLLAAIAASAQYSTVDSVKADIQAKVVSNATKAITADVLRKILLGLWGYNTDTLWQNGNTIYYRRGGISFPLGSFGGVITSPNTPNRWWNGYKQFVPINTDSIPEGGAGISRYYTPTRDALNLHLAGNERVTGKKTFDDTVILGNKGLQIQTTPNTNVSLLNTVGSGSMFPWMQIKGNASGSQIIMGANNGASFADMLTLTADYATSIRSGQYRALTLAGNYETKIVGNEAGYAFSDSAIQFAVGNSPTDLAAIFNRAGKMVSFKGLQYGSNLAGGYTARSLTDKNYVDSSVAAHVGIGSESDPTIPSTIKNIPVSADVTTNKYLNWNGSGYARQQIIYSDLGGSVPTWNQNTSGSAAKLTTAKNIFGFSFDGTSDLASRITKIYLPTTTVHNDTINNYSNVQNFNGNIYTNTYTGGSAIHFGNSGEPSIPNQGDFWYTPSADELRIRASGVTRVLATLTGTQAITNKNLTSGNTFPSFDTTNVPNAHSIAYWSGIFPQYSKVLAAIDSVRTSARNYIDSVPGNYGLKPFKIITSGGDTVIRFRSTIYTNGLTAALDGTGKDSIIVTNDVITGVNGTATWTGSLSGGNLQFVTVGNFLFGSGGILINPTSNALTGATFLGSNYISAGSTSATGNSSGRYVNGGSSTPFVFFAGSGGTTTGLDGIGMIPANGELDFETQNGSGRVIAAGIRSVTSDYTAGSEDRDLALFTMANGDSNEVIKMNNAGAVKFTQYPGSFTSSDTTRKPLVMDAQGNITRSTAWFGGGGGGSTARRLGSTTSSATPSINTDNYDVYTLSAQTVDITSFTTNLTGTPTDGQRLEIRIKGTASRAITWGASFTSSTISLPATTNATNMLYITLEYNGSTWVCIGVA